MKRMRYFREICGRAATFIKQQNLINDESNIMVGLSGGKDSLTLLQVLAAFRRSSRWKYGLAAGYVDLGLGADYAPLASFCQRLEIPFYREETDIGAVVFDIRKEKNPCSLCAKMRRGALNDLAKRNGFSKIALGHNQDDYIETFLLNLFFAGRVGSFRPRTYLDRRDLTVIRPLLSVPAELLAKHAQNDHLPVMHNPCPADGQTRREDMRRLVRELTVLYPNGRELAFRAIERYQGQLGDNYIQVEKHE